MSHRFSQVNKIVKLHDNEIKPEIASACKSEHRYNTNRQEEKKLHQKLRMIWPLVEQTRVLIITNTDSSHISSDWIYLTKISMEFNRPMDYSCFN